MLSPALARSLSTPGAPLLRGRHLTTFLENTCSYRLRNRNLSSACLALYICHIIERYEGPGSHVVIVQE